MSIAAVPTIAEIAEHVEHDLSDDAIQRLIDDAEEEVIARFGAHASQTERLLGNSLYLHPRRPISSITSIAEVWSQTSQTLSASDYEIVNGGREIKRLANGAFWAPEVDLVYAPVGTWDSRRRVIIDLVKLAIQFNGLQAEAVGDYSSQSVNYYERREEILGCLRERQRQFA